MMISGPAGGMASIASAPQPCDTLQAPALHYYGNSKGSANDSGTSSATISHQCVRETHPPAWEMGRIPSLGAPAAVIPRAAALVPQQQIEAPELDELDQLLHVAMFDDLDFPLRQFAASMDAENNTGAQAPVQPGATMPAQMHGFGSITHPGLPEAAALPPAPAHDKSLNAETPTSVPAPPPPQPPPPRHESSSQATTSYGSKRVSAPVPPPPQPPPPAPSAATAGVPQPPLPPLTSPFDAAPKQDASNGSHPPTGPATSRPRRTSSNTAGLCNSPSASLLAGFARTSLNTSGPLPSPCQMQTARSLPLQQPLTSPTSVRSRMASASVQHNPFAPTTCPSPMGPSAFGLAGPDAAGADVAALAPGSFNGAPLTAGRSSSMPASLLHQPSMEPSGSEGQDVEANMVGSEEADPSTEDPAPVAATAAGLLEPTSARHLSRSGSIPRAKGAAAGCKTEDEGGEQHNSNPLGLMHASSVPIAWDAPDPLGMLGLGIERPRKKHNGRRPLMDPRLDPNIDPKKAQRILANRQSAARTKLRQQMIIESAKAREASAQAKEEELDRMRASLELEISRVSGVTHELSELKGAHARLKGESAQVKKVNASLLQHIALLEGKLLQLGAPLPPHPPGLAELVAAAAQKSSAVPGALHARARAASAGAGDSNKEAAGREAIKVSPRTRQARDAAAAVVKAAGMSLGDGVTGGATHRPPAGSMSMDVEGAQGPGAGAVAEKRHSSFRGTAAAGADGAAATAAEGAAGPPTHSRKASWDDSANQASQQHAVVGGGPDTAATAMETDAGGPSDGAGLVVRRPTELVLEAGRQRRHTEGQGADHAQVPGGCDLGLRLNLRPINTTPRTSVDDTAVVAYIGSGMVPGSAPPGVSTEGNPCSPAKRHQPGGVQHRGSHGSAHHEAIHALQHEGSMGPALPHHQQQQGAGPLNGGAPDMAALMHDSGNNRRNSSSAGGAQLRTCTSLSMDGLGMSPTMRSSSGRMVLQAQMMQLLRGDSTGIPADALPGAAGVGSRGGSGGGALPFTSWPGSSTDLRGGEGSTNNGSNIVDLNSSGRLQDISSQAMAMMAQHVSNGGGTLSNVMNVDTHHPHNQAGGHSSHNHPHNQHHHNSNADIGSLPPQGSGVGTAQHQQRSFPSIVIPPNNINTHHHQPDGRAAAVAFMPPGSPVCSPPSPLRPPPAEQQQHPQLHHSFGHQQQQQQQQQQPEVHPEVVYDAYGRPLGIAGVMRVPQSAPANAGFRSDPRTSFMGQMHAPAAEYGSGAPANPTLEATRMLLGDRHPSSSSGITATTASAAEGSAPASIFTPASMGPGVQGQAPRGAHVTHRRHSSLASFPTGAPHVSAGGAGISSPTGGPVAGPPWGEVLGSPNSNSMSGGGGGGGGNTGFAGHPLPAGPILRHLALTSGSVPGAPQGAGYSRLLSQSGPIQPSSFRSLVHDGPRAAAAAARGRMSGGGGLAGSESMGHHAGMHPHQHHAHSALHPHSHHQQQQYQHGDAAHHALAMHHPGLEVLIGSPRSASGSLKRSAAMMH